MQILRASTNEQLLLCYGVMKELRPHHTAETFMETIRQMFGEGYQLWYIEDEGQAVCAAGFRNHPTKIPANTSCSKSLGRALAITVSGNTFANAKSNRPSPGMCAPN